MRVLLVGCVKSSAIFLDKMIEKKVNIVGVVTKKESRYNSDFVDLGVICKKNNIDYIYISDINDCKSIDYIKKKEVDILLCLGWSQLLKENVLSIPKMGCVGFHPSELPYNRGRHPLIWALALGLERTASTFFWMEETADSGKVISQEEIKIEYRDNASSLYDKVMNVACRQLITLLQGIERGAICYEKDDEHNNYGNTWRKRGIEDGKIDWRMSTKGIYNLVRALTVPYVGAHFTWHGMTYKVWQVEECKEWDDSQYANIEPGKVLKVEDKEGIFVKAGDGIIKILECDAIEINEGEYL